MGVFNWFDIGLRYRLHGRGFRQTILAIDPSYKSYNILDKYPTLHHFVTEICTHVHISVTKWCILVGMELCIVWFVQRVYSGKRSITQWSTALCTINQQSLTHWGRVTLICVSKLTIIGSDNGLSPDRRQAIILTNAGILLIGPWETNFSEILIGIHTFSFKKIHLKMSSAKWRPLCLGLNVLRWWLHTEQITNIM